MAAEAASSSSSSKMISLKSADGDVFEVEPSIAKQMQTVQTFIADVDADADAVIPLPNIYTRELSKIIDYGKQHRAAAAKDHDAEFFKEVNDEEMMELILAAHYLNMTDLFEFLTQVMADRIQNKSVEHVRKVFRFADSGYTAKEEAEIREKNAWAFKGVDQDDE
ncbi:SKP1-like protein 14 [Lotus japonicus]|uniref:SKP1-like protein 14 n=1 Tax=Lotus japonicus TaxID=34305 RepID=UPI00258FA048|nr:SKP1-like protein 14 [Lotus japonicus]